MDTAAAVQFCVQFCTLLLSRLPAATIVKAFPAAIWGLPPQAGGDYREGIPAVDVWWV